MAPNSRPAHSSETPVVVAAASPVALTVVRSLGRRGIPVVVTVNDVRDIAQYSKHVYRAVSVPSPLEDEAGFVQALVELGGEMDKPVLIPASDAGLAAIAARRTALSPIYRMADQGAGAVDAALQKEKGYEILQKAGIRVPRTAIVTSRDELEVELMRTEFPALLKPSQSHLFVEQFGVKMYEASSASEVRELWAKASEAGLDVMLQELIPGTDNNRGFNYNCYVAGGTFVAEFTARKVRNSPSMYGSPRVVVSDPNPEIIEIGRRTIEALGLGGFSCSEFKPDPRTGEWVLIEVNARHNLSSSLAVALGIDFPWIDYNAILGRKVETAPEYEGGTFWIDIARDAVTSVTAYRSERLGLRKLSRPYRHPHTYAVLDWHDLRPFAAHIPRGLRGLFRRSRKVSSAH